VRRIPVTRRGAGYAEQAGRQQEERLHQSEDALDGDSH
jgi:hypothetical protein